MPTRRNILRRTVAGGGAASLLGLAGCTGARSQRSLRIDDSGSLDLAWWRPHIEPVERVLATDDGVYVGTAAFGPTDVVDLVPDLHAYMGGASAYAHDGRSRWHRTFPTRVRSVHIAEHGTYLVTGAVGLGGAYRQQLRKLSPDGRDRWETPTLDEYHVALVTDDRVYLGRHHHRPERPARLTALRPDGTTVWTRTVPAVDRIRSFDGVLVIDDGREALVAYEATTGDELWRRSGVIRGALPGRSGLVLAEFDWRSNPPGTVDVTSGSVRSVLEEVHRSPIVVGEHVVCSSGSTVLASDWRDGTVAWVAPVGQQVLSLDLAGDTVVACSRTEGKRESTVTAVDPESGDVRWRTRIPGTIRAVHGVGRFVLVGGYTASGHFLTAFDAESGEADTRLSGEERLPRIEPGPDGVYLGYESGFVGKLVVTR